MNPDREMVGSASPLVSIVVCVFNGVEFLDEVVGTVLAQTWTNWELIFVDDGSSDGSAEVIRRYPDPRIRLLVQPNRGASSALAAGIEAATGEFVALLDQDDTWEPEKLEVHVNRMRERPDLDLTFSWFVYVDKRGEELGLKSIRYRGSIDFTGLLADFVIGATSNVVVRKEAVCRAGGVDATIPRLYDLDLFLRIALRRPGNVEAVPRDLMRYRRHGEQLSRDFAILVTEWESFLAKMRRLAPKEVSEAEGTARCSINRYFARLAYEQRSYRESVRFVWRGFRSSPVVFVLDARNWLTAAACWSGALLPGWLHSRLERVAGLRR
jgi:glycosyltransferase involved in cell wall biosynthesis